MRVLVAPADTEGCGHYRLIWPARAVGAALVLPGEPWVKARYRETPAGPRIHSLVEVPEVDVVVMQRCAYRDTADIVPHLQAAGIAVVVDVDDDFTCIQSGNVAHDHYDPALSPDRNYEHLLRACQAADLVTVSTPALARRYGQHGRVAVLPNCVPARYLSEHGLRRMAGRGEGPLTKLRVGWSGSLETHPGDLEVAAGSIGAVVRVRQAHTLFHTIGTGKGVKEALGLPHSTATGWVDLAQYPTALAHLDVGVVPLQRCAFNRAKSWLKGLEMAAVGVPFVASALPEYERLARLGAGRLAARPVDWERELSALVCSPAMRDDLRAAGHDVAREWTYERRGHLWAEVWERAAARRKVLA